jgi:predicted NBD/HSP70 family sugar kinase
VETARLGLAIRIGIDLGGTKTEIIALGPSGETVLRRREPTPANDYGATVGLLVRLVKEAATELGSDHSFSVGVGTPGSLSPVTGFIRNSNSTCLIGRPLRQELERALGKTVRMANDADCFALSEALDGAARGAATVFGVILGTGVGGGIVVNGRVLSGPNAIAGEWGHNPLPWPRDEERPGPACYCGKPGCIETFLSGPGLALDHERAAGEKRRPEEIVERARNGEERASAALQRYEDRLARALATVINVVDPDVIVLGGGMSNVESLYERVPPLLARWIFSDVVRTRLVPNAHGDSSGVRGAAMLWPPQAAA